MLVYTSAVRRLPDEPWDDIREKALRHWGVKCDAIWNCSCVTARYQGSPSSQGSAGAV